MESDITGLVKRHALLDFNQLIHAPDFDYYDTIHAIPLMNPKMDSGLAVPESLVPCRLTLNRCVNLFDLLLASMQEWLAGHLVASSTHCCLPVIKDTPPEIQEWVAKMVSIQSYAYDFIARFGIYYEEDFAPDLSGFVLSKSESECLLEPFQELECENGYSEERSMAAIKARLEFVDNVQSLFAAMTFHDQPQVVATCKKSLQCLEILIGSVDCGSDALDLFNPLINHHRFAQIPPSQTVRLTAVQGLDAWKSLINYIQSVSMFTGSLSPSGILADLPLFVRDNYSINILGRTWLYVSHQRFSHHLHCN